jgi:hypothetical protein
MRLMLEETGFELLDFTTAGTFFGPVKQAVFSPFSAMARLTMGELATGDVAIYLTRKTSTAAPASAGRDSFYFRTTGA